MQQPRLHPLGEAEHVDGPHDVRLDRLDGVELVVDRRGGAREVEDPVHLQQHRLDDVVAHHLEVAVIQEVSDVGATPGVEVVEADHLVTIPEQALAEVAPDEAGSAGDEGSHPRSLDGQRSSRLPTTKTIATRAPAPIVRQALAGNPAAAGR